MPARAGLFAGSHRQFSMVIRTTVCPARGRQRLTDEWFKAVATAGEPRC